MEIILVRYDTIRYCVFSQKLTGSQLQSTTWNQTENLNEKRTENKPITIISHVCLFVCLSVCLSSFQSYGLYCRPVGSPTWAFQKEPFLDLQDNPERQQTSPSPYSADGGGGLSCQSTGGGGDILLIKQIGVGLDRAMRWESWHHTCVSERLRHNYRPVKGKLDIWQ